MKEMGIEDQKRRIERMKRLIDAIKAGRIKGKLYSILMPR